MKVRSEIPTAENTTNMDGFGTCEVGTTLENLKAAIGGETGASAKYAAFAQAAKEQGYEQIARLFEATSAAEQIHIGLEYALVAEVEPDFEKPAAPEAEGVQTDLNLIMGAQGEIFETSDMYPAFIKKAQEEGNTKAVQVFTRAKLAEAYHANPCTPSATWRRTTTSTLPTTTSSTCAPSAVTSTRARTSRSAPSASARRPPSARSKPTHQAFPSARNGRPRAAVSTSAASVFIECFT